MGGRRGASKTIATTPDARAPVCESMRLLPGICSWLYYLIESVDVDVRRKYNRVNTHFAAGGRFPTESTVTEYSRGGVGRPGLTMFTLNPNLTMILDYTHCKYRYTCFWNVRLSGLRLPTLMSAM